MKEKPIILLLESATEVCSVALSHGADILAVRESSEGNRHSEWMTTYMDDVIKQAKINRTDIDAIAVSQGPGSYTGLRVAYSVAKGFAFALQLPMIEVDTLQSLASAFIQTFSPEDQSLVIPMIDARRMEVYQRLYDSKGRTQGDLTATILEEKQFSAYLDNYKHLFLVGNGAQKVKNLELPMEIMERISIHEEITCSARHMSLVALSSFHQASFSDVAYCVPHYLKSPNITTSTKHLLVQP